MALIEMYAFPHATQDKHAAFEGWAKRRGYDLTRCSSVWNPPPLRAMQPKALGLGGWRTPSCPEKRWTNLCKG